MRGYVIFSGTPLAQNRLTPEACVSYVASNLTDKKPIYFVGEDKNSEHFFSRIRRNDNVMVPEGEGLLPVFEVTIKAEYYSQYVLSTFSDGVEPCLISTNDIEAVVRVSSVFDTKDKGLWIDRGVQFGAEHLALMNKQLEICGNLKQLKCPQLKLAFEALIQKTNGLSDVEHQAESIEMTHLMLQEYLTCGANLEDLKDTAIYQGFEQYAKDRAYGHPSPGMQKVGFLMLAIAALIAAQIALIPAAIVGAVGLGSVHLTN
jgi:hypothetical protein